MKGQSEAVGARIGRAPFEVSLACNSAEVREAQRLRFAVFGLEMGARLPSAATGLDCDAWDAHCDHLIVRETAAGRVVGTYRLLPAERVGAAGGWYCAAEFNLAALLPHAARIVETGRACVAAPYRSGLVIALLWGGVLRYVRAQGATHVIGCASIGTDDGGHIAASVCRRLLRDHLAAPAWRVQPRRAFVLEGWRDIVPTPLPPLLKGYLRLGAEVCGEPAWDPAFRSADLLMRLDLSRANPRYVDRLLRAG